MSTEHQDDDPAASPLRHFGNEVRLERERLGMTRDQLGDAANCGYSLVAKIEAGERLPSEEFAKACDRVFPHSGGRFARLWPLALRFAFPPWFRPYVELERKAVEIRMFHPQLLPGLVQTPEYARAVLRPGRPTNLDDLVTARIERQRVLTREKPARLWLVLNEAVLTNTVGNAKIMQGQLARLRELAETPVHRVQIIRNRGQHHGWASPFGLLSFNKSDKGPARGGRQPRAGADAGNDVVHVDGFPRGYILAEPDDVAAAQDAYDLLRAMAASPDESAEIIDAVLKDHYP
ncbi:helix-turn-helix transcriptional regulator [Streptomyces capparidis]